MAANMMSLAVQIFVVVLVVGEYQMLILITINIASCSIVLKYTNQHNRLLYWKNLVFVAATLVASQSSAAVTTASAVTSVSTSANTGTTITTTAAPTTHSVSI